MSKKKEKKYTPKEFESEREFLPVNKENIKVKDVSANIYISMLQSKAWHNLTSKQKELYLYCKAQYYGERKSKAEHLTVTEKECEKDIDISKRFTMNKSKWCEIYGLYTNGTQRYFYSDMKALIENGFVQTIEKGKTSRTKNIYEFSGRWKEQGRWEKGEKP